jgi:hypothetical protein
MLTHFGAFSLRAFNFRVGGFFREKEGYNYSDPKVFGLAGQIASAIFEVNFTHKETSIMMNHKGSTQR